MKHKAGFRGEKKCMSDTFFQMFLSSSTYPEIHGYLHAKEQGKKSWKKLYFLLRRSGLYFSTKGTSKVREEKKRERAQTVKSEQICMYLSFVVIIEPKIYNQIINLVVIKNEKINLFIMDRI